jgi:serine/threonine protein kinase
VAVKMITTDTEITDELRARFFREAQAIARLSHPNILTIFDLGEDAGRLFTVMELLDGVELRQIIAERRPMSLAEKLSIMIQVCDGLGYAHERGIVHRDVKPGNIFVLRSGTVKILDFGVAQIASVAASGLTQTGLVIGTLRYISPEQARGRADQRSDIFSTGAVFYEFLSYRPPFGGNDPMEILEAIRSEEPRPLTTLDPSIPRELAVVVERALRKDPALRFQTLREMQEQLAQVQRQVGGGIGATPSLREECQAPLREKTVAEPPQQRTEVVVLPTDKLVDMPRQRAMALVVAAREQLAQDEVDGAAERIREALAFDPDLPEAHALKEQILARVTERYETRRMPGDSPELPSAPGRIERIKRYQVIRLVGRGPSGLVYRAWDLVHERMVALKVIAEDSVLNKERFHRAALTWLRLDRPPTSSRYTTRILTMAFPASSWSSSKAGNWEA